MPHKELWHFSRTVEINFDGINTYRFCLLGATRFAWGFVRRNTSKWNQMLDWFVLQKEILGTILESRHESLTGAAMSLSVMKFRLGMRINTSTILLLSVSEWLPCTGSFASLPKYATLCSHHDWQWYYGSRSSWGIWFYAKTRHVLLCQNRGFANVGCDGNRFVWVQTSQALEITVDFLQSAEAQLFLNFESRFACIFISYESRWYLPWASAICVVVLTSQKGGSFATFTSSRWAFRRNAKGIDSHWPWGSGVTGCLGDGGHKSLGTLPSQREILMD